MNYVIINITMEATCIVFSFIIMLFFLFESKKEEKIDRYFVTMVTCNIFALCGDLNAYTFENSPGHNGIIYVSNEISLFFGFCIFAVFIEYVDEFMKYKRPLSPWVKKGGLIISLFYEIAILIQIPTHILYYVDEFGVYHTTKFYGLIEVGAATTALYFMIVMVVFRKSMGKRELISILSFAALPAVASVAQVFYPEPNFVYPSSTIAIFIIYSTIHKDIARKLKETETDLAQARLNLVMSQIQPHFMYNSLTAIAQLCTIDPKRAQRATIDFSNYLRGNLDSVSYTRPIPFSQELKHLQTYLSLELMRFDDRLSVEYDIEIDSFMVPALSVQPLVENAVKHGVCKKQGGGTVWISTREENNCFKIIIKDDGVGFDMNAPLSKDKSHIGVSNVRSRIESMMGGTLEITSEVGVGTTSVLTIPKKTNEQFLKEKDDEVFSGR